MSTFDKIRSNARGSGRQIVGSAGEDDTEHVCVFCGRDFDASKTRDCPTCGAELLYRGDR